MINDELNNCLISVIVPVYNVESYIEKCLDSLLNQSFISYEILTIDDGSTDNSGVICDAYSQKDNRIKVFHKENGGLSDARNYGLLKARGQYITFIDSDDYVDRDYLEYLYDLLHEYNTQVSVCQLRVILENGRIKDRGTRGKNVLTGKECLEEMLYHGIVDTTACAKLYKIELFNDIKYPTGKQFEDISTTYKFFLKCNRVAVGYETKYNYVYRSSSIVNCSFNPQKLDLIDMTDAMGEEVFKSYPDLMPAIQRRRVYSRFSTLNQMLHTEQYSEEKNELISFIKSNGKMVINDPKTPIRDRLAILLLNVSYRLYKTVWTTFGRK